MRRGRGFAFPMVVVRVIVVLPPVRVTVLDLVTPVLLLMTFLVFVRLRR